MKEALPQDDEYFIQLEGGASARHGDALFDISFWSGERQTFQADTIWGFAQSGPLQLRCSSGDFALQTGMYFAAAGTATLQGSGQALVICQRGFTGFFHLGGPIETRGRLRYINGCSDSLLIPPLVKGDACLNLLHIPTGTEQSEHTHPSFRCGVVAAGGGVCETPAARHPLQAGLAFLIPPGKRHRFITGENDLLVAAFHPDSDCGPTHENHPMLNRTIINGASASGLQPRTAQ